MLDNRVINGIITSNDAKLTTSRVSKVGNKLDMYMSTSLKTAYLPSNDPKFLNSPWLDNTPRGQFGVSYYETNGKIGTVRITILYNEND